MELTHTLLEQNVQAKLHGLEGCRMADHDLRPIGWPGAPVVVSWAALSASLLIATGCTWRAEPITRTVLEVFPGQREAQRTDTLLVCFATPIDEHVTEQIAPVVTRRLYTGAVFRPLFVQGLVTEFANVRETDGLSGTGDPADYVVVISEFGSERRESFSALEMVVSLRCEVRAADGHRLAWKEISTSRSCTIETVASRGYETALAYVLGEALEACAKGAIAFITETVDSEGGKK